MVDEQKREVNCLLNQYVELRLHHNFKNVLCEYSHAYVCGIPALLKKTDQLEKVFQHKLCLTVYHVKSFVHTSGVF